jgi:probable F420-dependent oxidoreductase
MNGAMRLETMLPGTEPNVAMAGAGSEARGIEFIAESARQIEDWGFDGLTTPETGHDPFLPCVIAAEHTSRVTIGTNVAIAFPRSPMTVAQIAWDLHRWSGGRFKLGIGTQVKGHNERRYSAPWTAPPGPRMREYIGCLRAIFQTFQSGSLVPFRGEHYRFDLISPFFNPGPLDLPSPAHGRRGGGKGLGHVPIYISALNPYMARLAGETCDGLRLHPLSTVSYVNDVLRPAVVEGSKKAGRNITDIEIVSMPFTITGRTQAEVEAAKAQVRMHIAFYASTRTYHAVLRHHGWEEVGLKLHELSMQGRWPEMGQAITDEMLDQFAVTGTYDELMPKLRSRWKDACDTVFIPMPPGAADAEMTQLVKSFRMG